jgi:hypothetical protein
MAADFLGLYSEDEDCFIASANTGRAALLKRPVRGCFL